MMATGAHATINRTARLAGGLYLALMPFGFFGILYVPSVLIVPGDAATTARNILASEWLLRSGTVSHLVGQIIFIFWRWRCTGSSSPSTRITRCSWSSWCWSASP